MLIANDVSHHNTVQELWTKLLFIKASEGKSYKDDKRNVWVRQMAEQAQATATTTPYMGFYHFARPDLGNTPMEELQNYIDATAGHKGFAVALDWENKALIVKDAEKWALEWLENAEKLLGTTPMFYVQASSVSKYPRIAAKYPLWIACYSQDSRAKKYKAVMDMATMIQVTSHPIDIDIWLKKEKDLIKMITGV